MAWEIGAFEYVAPEEATSSTPIALPKEFTPGYSTHTKPVCDVEIDWSNSLTRDFRHLYNGNLQDLAGNTNAILTNGAIERNNLVNPSASSHSAQVGTANDDLLPDGTSDFTYFVQFKINAHPGFGIYASLFSTLPSTFVNASNYIVPFYIRGGTAPAFRFQSSTPALNLNGSGGYVYEVGKTYIAIVRRSGTLTTLTFEGVDLDSGTDGADYYNRNSYIPTLGAQTDGARPCDCEISLFGLVDRAWTDAEVASFTVNPFQILKPKLETLYFPDVESEESSDTEITATTATLTLTENNATVAHDIGISATTDAFTVTTNDATVSYGVNISATTDTFTVTANQATITNDVGISATTDTFTVTTNDATVAYVPAGDTVISAETATLTVSTNNATVSNDIGISATLASLTITANTATVANDVSITATAQELTLATYDATVAGSKNISCNIHELTLETFPCTVQGGAQEEESTGGFAYPSPPSRKEREEQRRELGILPKKLPKKPKKYITVKDIPQSFESVRTLDEAKQTEMYLKDLKDYLEGVNRRGQEKQLREAQDRETLNKILGSLAVLEERRQRIEEQDMVFVMISLMA